MRSMFANGLLLVMTGIVMAGSYTVNLKASAERSAVTRLRMQLVDDAGRIRELEAELRTRARLPEMQRWNDMVLHMAAPQSVQFLKSPVQLAGYAAVPGGSLPGEGTPSVRYAVTGEDAIVVPVAPGAAAPQTVAYPVPGAAVPAPAPAATTAATGIVKAAYVAPAAPAQAAPPGDAAADPR